MEIFFTHYNLIQHIQDKSKQLRVSQDLIHLLIFLFLLFEEIKTQKI